jgi:hypothetical protein
MIDLSFVGLMGAFLGTAVAAVVYAPLVSTLERFLGRDPAWESTGNDRTVSEEDAKQEISLLRRGVLAADIMAFAGLGYWLAVKLAG